MHVVLEWQKYWLIEELKKSKAFDHTFVFMNRSIVEFDFETIFDDEKNYILDKEYKEFLHNTFAKYDVTTVFASIAGMQGKKTIDGVDYVISGASGGTLIVDNPDSFYHYIKVNINDNGVSYEVVEQGDMNQGMIVRLIENIWIYIHSVFYINYLNFIILLGVIVLLIVILYKKAWETVDYYRDFNVDQKIDKDKQLNILMVTNNYLPFIGGVPVSINRALKGLKAQGNKVTVFAPEYPGLKSTEDDVVRFKLLKHFDDKKFEFPIVNVFSRKFDKEFKKLDIDVIHVHHPFWMGSRGLRLGKKYNKPVVLTYHTRLEEYSHFLPAFQLVFKNIVSHQLIKNFSQKCDVIISPTYTAKEYLRNIGVSRPKFVIPTGVDLDRYIEDKKVDNIREKYASNGEKLLCTVSRLSTEKNIYFILKGVEYIKEHTSTSFKLLMIGDGNEKEGIEKYIVEHDLEDYVKLIGKVPPETVTKYYLASDLFVFSSLSETQGMVILEAMAGGCPVVAVRASGIDDIVENRYNGFKTKNNVKEWSEKVIQLLASKELYQTMKSNALEYAKDYSIVEVGKKIENAYYYALENRKA
jgi:glycosyltransferase involved in cell wall biosynthesis